MVEDIIYTRLIVSRRATNREKVWIGRGGRKSECGLGLRHEFCLLAPRGGRRPWQGLLRCLIAGGGLVKHVPHIFWNRSAPSGSNNNINVSMLPPTSKNKQVDGKSP